MRKRWKWTFVCVLGLLVVALGAVGWRVYGMYHQLDEMSKPKEESRFAHFEENTEYKPPEWEGSERVNVLLMGGDERGLQPGEVARSDTMMVASFDPASKKVHLFSVLRDTYVKIPDHGRGRINTAITLGGPPLAMKTVGDMLGLDIQYYVYVDFEGFIKLVDAVGGIDYYVEKNMHYTDAADGHKFDIDLKKGQQHLDGSKALQYVRFRHDAMSDFTRTERQRNFLKAVADKLKSGWNLVKLPEILAQVTPFVETNMSTTDMLKLGTLGYRSHQAGSAQIPPMELVADEKVGGSSVLGVRDSDALKDYVQMTLSSDASQPAAASASAGSSTPVPSRTSTPVPSGASTPVAAGTSTIKD